MAKEGAILSKLGLASRGMVFLPRLRGTAQRARSSRRDQAHKGESEVLAPISLTNTGIFESVAWVSDTLQAVLSHLSHFSGSTGDRFG